MNIVTFYPYKATKMFAKSRKTLKFEKLSLEHERLFSLYKVLEKPSLQNDFLMRATDSSKVD